MDNNLYQFEYFSGNNLYIIQLALLNKNNIFVRLVDNRNTNIKFYGEITINSLISRYSFFKKFVYQPDELIYFLINLFRNNLVTIENCNFNFIKMILTGFLPNNYYCRYEVLLNRELFQNNFMTNRKIINIQLKGNIINNTNLKNNQKSTSNKIKNEKSNLSFILFLLIIAIGLGASILFKDYLTDTFKNLFSKINKEKGNKFESNIIKSENEIHWLFTQIAILNEKNKNDLKLTLIEDDKDDNIDNNAINDEINRKNNFNGILKIYQDKNNDIYGKYIKFNSGNENENIEYLFNLKEKTITKENKIIKVYEFMKNIITNDKTKSEIYKVEL